MSAEGASALYERVSSDEGFRAQLEGAKSPDDKRRIVTEAGYEVTRDDLNTIRKLGGVTEMSDEDLEKVAGGAGTTAIWTAVGGAGGAVAATAAALV